MARKQIDADMKRLLDIWYDDRDDMLTPAEKRRIKGVLNDPPEGTMTAERAYLLEKVPGWIEFCAEGDDELAFDRTQDAADKQKGTT